MSDKTDTGTERVKKAARAIYLAVPQAVARDIAGLLKSLAAERDTLRAEVERLRKALQLLLAYSTTDAVHWEDEEGFESAMSDARAALAPPAAPSEQDNTTGKETT